MNVQPSAAAASDSTSRRSSSSPSQRAAMSAARSPAGASRASSRIPLILCQPSAVLWLLIGAARASGFHLAPEPGFRRPPLALDGPGRDPGDLGGFFDGQSGEETELDDPG